MIELLLSFLALLIVVLAFLTYYSTAPVAVKMTVFPALIAAIIFGYTIFIDQLGAPIHAYPEKEFQYVFHQSGENGEVIYIWVWTADRGQRLHIIPYDRETMEQLEEAKGRAEDGQEYGQFKSSGNGFVYETADEPRELTEGFTK